MAGEKKIAASYASALFSLATEQDLADTIYQDMLLLADVLQHNPELRYVMASPVIKGSKKKAIFEALFGSQLHDLTIRFLYLMIKSFRIILLKEISQQVIKLYKDYKGIRTVHLRTAVEINEVMRMKFQNKLREVLHSEVDLVEVTDPGIIGGFVLQLDDNRYDASFRSKLDKLDRQFNINIFKKGF
jgi:F-type H+-transporting ATPase subunit delta